MSDSGVKRSGLSGIPDVSVRMGVPGYEMLRRRAIARRPMKQCFSMLRHLVSSRTPKFKQFVRSRPGFRQGA